MGEIVLYKIWNQIPESIGNLLPCAPSTISPNLPPFPRFQKYNFYS